MDNYKVESIIGSGTYGTVYLVKLNGHSYAMKEINLHNLKPVEKQRAFNEASLLAKLNHRFIIKYKDSSLDHITGRLLIVTDYAECGNLSNAIIKRRWRPFSTTKVLCWFVQICLALQYIHSQNILHRDLKTTNIFLCRDNTLKVGDFGIARVLDNSQALADTAIGTPYYMSPEILMRKPYNSKSDMWALGCILFEMSALIHPFEADSFPHLMNLILTGERRPFPAWCSDLIKQFVEKLLCLDPDRRPSIDEVLAYPCLQSNLSLYEEKPEKMLPASTRKPSRSPDDSCKRSTSPASATSSNCSKAKVFKFSPGTTEERKPLSSLTRVIPPSIVVTEFKTPMKMKENEKKSRSVSIRATTSAVVTECKNEQKRKPRSASTQASPPSVFVAENEQRSRSATATAIPPVIVVTDCEKENKFVGHEWKLQSAPTQSTQARRLAISHSPPEYKTANNDFNSKLVIKTSKHNVTYTIKNEKNSENMNSSEETTPNDIDYGYSSEEINCSADSPETSICEHSINTSKNEFSILNGNENEEKSIDRSHCQHSQCHQCMIDMMWKNRIRSCAGASKDDSDYLKLKKKLLLSFGPHLFEKVYKSLLKEWEGSENAQSKAPLQKFVKLLNYEQVQNLPLMMQFIQLDMVKISKDATYLQSKEFIMI